MHSARILTACRRHTTSTQHGQLLHAFCMFLHIVCIFASIQHEQRACKMHAPFWYALCLSFWSWMFAFWAWVPSTYAMRAACIQNARSMQICVHLYFYVLYVCVSVHVVCMLYACCMHVVCILSALWACNLHANSMQHACTCLCMFDLFVALVVRIFGSGMASFRLHVVCTLHVFKLHFCIFARRVLSCMVHPCVCMLYGYCIWMLYLDIVYIWILYVDAFHMRTARARNAYKMHAEFVPFVCICGMHFRVYFVYVYFALAWQPPKYIQRAYFKHVPCICCMYLLYAFVRILYTLWQTLCIQKACEMHSRYWCILYVFWLWHGYLQTTFCMHFVGIQPLEACSLPFVRLLYGYCIWIIGCLPHAYKMSTRCMQKVQSACCILVCLSYFETSLRMYFV